MSIKELILEYVYDHYNTFGFYPYDVEVHGHTYTYNDYWRILN